MYRKGLKGWMKHWDFMVLDLLCMQIAVTVAFLFRFGFFNPLESDDYKDLSILLLLADMITILFFEPFKNILKRDNRREFVELLKHVALVLLLVTFYLYSAREGSRYSRFVFYTFGFSYAFLSFVVRVLWKRYLMNRPEGKGKRALYLITSASLTEESVREIRESCYGIYHIIGLAVIDQDMRGQVIDGVRVDACRDDITEILMREWVDEVFINLPRDMEIPGSLMEDLTEMGIAVHVNVKWLLKGPGQNQLVEHIGKSTVLTISMDYATTSKLFIKRLLDILGGVAGCVITGILCILIGPLIYIQSPGSIFFKQERVGRNGKRFWMYKFRSMYPDAEERKAQLISENHLEGQMMFKLEYDPRIIGSKKLPDGTIKKGIGNFIRDWSLDEFPQFYNVLKGDMSLVGTRPPTVDEWERYEPYHRGRLAMKPGITGLWQVSGRSKITDFDEVVKLDREYIQSWSIGGDIRIIAKTLEVVLRRDGAM